jgi:hypothetical protein
MSIPAGWSSGVRPVARGAAVAVLLATLPAALRADALAEALEPHVGQTLDLVELGTGRRFVRPQLEKVVTRGGETQSLRLVEEGQARPTSILLKGITRIVVGRETVHEADPKAGGAAAKRARVILEKHEAEVAASHERMRARGVAPWPALSADEHAAEVAALEAFVEQVREAFPQLVRSATHEFIVATDIPPQEIGPFVASLDAMHDFLCDLYGIPRGEAVWKGKCLVIAFRQEADFQAFEARFMKVAAPPGVHGLCHQSSDGRVIMACHQGRDIDAFAHMLVHETSHGFNHRWISPQRLPNWLNEGLAEWVGTQVVPRSRQVPAKEAQARAFMQQSGALGPGFLTADTIEPVQYGIASQMVRFLVARDRKKFAEFVRGIKEGMTAEESLQATFRGSIDDLVAAFGASIGLPGLKP